LPYYRYRWQKNGEWLAITGVPIPQVPNEGTLVIADPQATHEGIYQCFASNPLGTASTVKTVLKKAGAVIGFICHYQSGKSVSQPICQSIIQPFRQSLSQPISQSISQSVNQLVNQLFSQSVSHLVSQSISQSIFRSLTQSVSRSFNWSGN